MLRAGVSSCMSATVGGSGAKMAFGALSAGGVGVPAAEVAQLTPFRFGSKASQHGGTAIAGKASKFSVNGNDLLGPQLSRGRTSTPLIVQPFPPPELSLPM